MGAAATFVGVAASSVIDQYAPHRAGGCGDEVAVAFPAIFSTGRDPQPGFVEEGRGLNPEIN